MNKSLVAGGTHVQVNTLMDALEATLIVGGSKLGEYVEHVYASDLMSDVLAFGKPNSILLTGLATRQAVITAHMAEFKGVVFVRGKVPKDGADRFAEDKDMILLSTQYDLYDACVHVESITKDGCPPETDRDDGKPVEPILLQQEFTVMGGDFTNAGMVSTEVKSLLRKIGYDSDLVRRAAISTYEGELNVIMHARRGKVYLSVTPNMVEVMIDDEGKGIPDIELAMEEGFTTATEEMRAMGFGSGMGLPNIKKNSDELKIFSEVEKGTRLIIRFYV